MRCTNDIRSKIQKALIGHRDTYIDAITKDIAQEEAKIVGWKKARLDTLKDSIEPIVKEWAKKNKKDYSSYRWEKNISSLELTNRVLAKFFYDSYSSRFPEVYTEKLIELKSTKDKFRTKVELIVLDVCIRVVSIKSLTELENLIEEGKKEITQAYENRGNL